MKTALALLLCATAAQAQLSTWTPTATQGFTVQSFAIPAQAIGPLPDATPLHVLVALTPRNRAQLDAAIAAVNTPGNPSYGKFLTPAQFSASYAPTAAQVQEVELYLEQLGFTNVSAPSNGLYVSAWGTAATATAAFDTPIWQYQVSGPLNAPSRTVFANTQPAQVPSSLAGIVTSVIGLQNIDSMHTRLGTWPAALAAPVPSPAVPANPATLTPQDFWKVYDTAQVPAADNTTIAIFASGSLAGIIPDPANPSAPNDLRQFEAEYGLPQVPVQLVKVGLGSTDTSGAVEFDMDTQTSTGLAGNVKSLIVYDADTLNDVDLIPSFNAFVTQNVAQAGSASFGGCETLEYASGALPLYDQIFREAAVQGQTVFASSGDEGAACGVSGAANGVPLAGVPGAVEFPASDTYVMGAGGTTLVVDASDNVIETLAWNAGGGGTSLWEYAPAWQAPFAPGATAGKGVPDVAMDADFLLSAAAFVSGGGDTSNGGTSLSSPLSLGAWARLQNAHGNTLGYAGPALYALATPGAPFSSITGFTDVVAGSNGIYPATPGWDYTTGLGSFDIGAIDSLLSAQGPSAAGSPCVAPGTTVVSQKAGHQTGAPANEEDDIISLAVAEPYPSSGETLVITMTVGDLAALPALPPNTFWKVSFSYAGQVYFVDMDTSAPGGTPAAPEFVYGVTTPDGAGGSGDSTLGPIAGSYDLTASTITWTLPASLLLPPVGTFPNVTAGTSGTPPGPGAKLASMHGTTQMLVGASAGLLETIDATADGVYTLVGNGACNPAAPVTALLSASPSSGTAPAAIGFDASASRAPLSGGAITSYTFNFGDGSAAVTQSSPAVSHTYSAAGSYSATVTVQDAGGGSGTSPTVNVTVSAPAQPPTASLRATPTSAKTQQAVAFDASGSTDPASGGGIVQYTFNFGDGTAPLSQAGATASHTYASAATYTASVTVTDRAGSASAASVALKVIKK